MMISEMKNLRCYKFQRCQSSWGNGDHQPPSPGDPSSRSESGSTILLPLVPLLQRLRILLHRVMSFLQDRSRSSGCSYKSEVLPFCVRVGGPRTGRDHLLFVTSCLNHYTCNSFSLPHPPPRHRVEPPVTGFFGWKKEVWVRSTDRVIESQRIRFTVPSDEFSDVRNDVR